MTTISRTTRNHLWIFAVCLLAMELLNLLPEDIVEIVHPTAILSCSLLVAWALTIRRRILSASVRKRLVAVAALMILVFVLALSRWTFFAWSPAANRFLWHAYYVPFSLVPLLSFSAALRVGKQETEKPSGVLFLLWPVWGILCGLLLTNSLHGWLFRHRAETGDSVDYGWLYGVTVAWITLLVIAFFLVLIRRSRLSRIRRLWFVPTAAFLFSAALLVWYFAEGGAPTIGDVKLFNLQEAFAFTVISIWESVIEIGLVPSNTDYEDLFRRSHLNAAIADDRGVLEFVSFGFGGNEGDRAADCLAEAEPADRRYVSKHAAIPGGTVYWTEDRSAIVRLNDAIREATETLEGENDLIEEENRVRAEKARYEAENRLYDRIALAVRPELLRVDETLKDEKAFEAGIRKTMVLGAYIKRRANLALLADESGRLSSDELWHAIRESCEYLTLSGAAADVRKDGETELPARMILLAFDFFETVAEEAFGSAAAFSAEIGASRSAEAFSLTVAVDRTELIPFANWRLKECGACGMTVRVRSEDDTAYYTLSAGREDAR